MTDLARSRVGGDLLKRLEELNRVGVALSQEKDIAKLLEAILVAAKDLTHADGGTLYRMTEEKTLKFEIIRNDTLGIAMGGTTGAEIPFYPIFLYDKDGMPVKEVDSAKVLERGLLRMDPERHTCTWKGEPVTLTVTEFLILQALAARAGVVKSRNALMDAAYDDQVYVDDRTIDSHIKRLRKKFKAVDDDFEMIETLYGVGYRFKE